MTRYNIPPQTSLHVLVPFRVSMRSKRCKPMRMIMKTGSTMQCNHEVKQIERMAIIFEES
eukprot:2254614-Rhodomonas_salina.1